MNRTSQAAPAASRGLLRQLRVPVALVCVAIATMGQSRGCCRGDEFPPVPQDDAGNYSWVRQVVPIVLGRKVKGHAELEFLADLVAQTDRPTVLRALMKQPAFQEHWGEVLVNALLVDREGIRAQQPCYGPPLRGGLPTPALAQHILGQPVTSAAAGGAFNMSDVVRSSVAADNLAPLYRAHVFALQHRAPDFGLYNTPQVRDELGRDFGAAYLHRQNLCMTCHNSDTSTTGPGSGWNRHFPILGSFEKALYGASTAIDPIFAHAMFRTDQHSEGAKAGFTAPWGMSGCGFFQATVATAAADNPYFTGPLPNGSTVTTLANLFKQGYDGLALDGLNRAVPAATQAACNFCTASCAGGTPADPEAVPEGTFVRGLLTDTSDSPGGFDCGDCHGSTQDLWFVGSAQPWHANLINIPANTSMGDRVVPGSAATSVLTGKLRGTANGARMPLGCTPAGPTPTCVPEADILRVEAWINALAPATACNSCPNLNCEPTELVPTEAFAYLAGARIVEVVWQEAMGYPVTVANYFPRNYSQRGVLWNLTEHVFIPNGWSLRELLVAILTSNLFNRHAPHTLAMGAEPYLLPMIYDPWSAADPRSPPASDPGYDPVAHPESHQNGMADGIYRYSARNLLASTHAAMDWPAPARFPQFAGYPNRDFQAELGQYFSAETPGFRSTNFGMLLRWEKEHGACANRNPGGADDWLARVVSAAMSFTPPAGTGPLTLEELVVLERDWLLGDGTLGTVVPPGLTESERQMVEAYLGSPLSTAANTLTAPVLEAKLRGVCGILQEAPQFLLAGVSPEALGPEPRLRVCNQPPCTYQELCEDLKDKLALPSHTTVTCNPSTVQVSILQRPPPLSPFCPQGVCKFVPIKLDPCLKNPARCRPEPPACDPRCARLDCCGGPLPAPGQEGVFVAWADGARVKQASGVRILRAGQRELRPLERGEQLKFGDLLEVPPSATLAVEGRDFQLGAKPSEGEDGREQRPRYLMVTGPPALALVEKPPVGRPLDDKQLQWVKTRGRLKHPDGEVPAVITPEMRAPGRLEKNWPKRQR